MQIYVEISQCGNLNQIKVKVIKDKKHVFLNYSDSVIQILIKDITSSIVIALTLEYQMYRWRQKSLSI